MATLNNRKRMLLKASTLVEVLVALVILLSIFAVGMLIFARLTQASRSHTDQLVQLQMRQIKEQYLQGVSADEEPLPLQQEHISYSIEPQDMAEYADRRRVRIVAYDAIQETVVDSLVFIVEKDDQQ